MATSSASSKESGIYRAPVLELGGEGGLELGPEPFASAPELGFHGGGAANDQISSDRRTGAMAWNTSARWRTTRATRSSTGSVDRDWSDVVPVALFLDPHRVVEDRFEVVEVVEHEPQRDSGPLRDAAGRGLGVAFLEEG